MADWLTTSEGEDLTQQKGDYEAPIFSGEPIPADTTALAMIEKCGWVEYEGDNYFNIQWSVLQPEEFKNRKVFQKLWLTDTDPRAKDADKKRDGAKRMLKAIDDMSGNPLVKSKRDLDSMDDAFMQKSLVNKIMIVKIMVWENNDKSGNYIAAIKKKDSEKPSIGKTAPRHTPPPKGTTAKQMVGDDDVPF